MTEHDLRTVRATRRFGAIPTNTSVSRTTELHSAGYSQLRAIARVRSTQLVRPTSDPLPKAAAPGVAALTCTCDDCGVRRSSSALPRGTVTFLFSDIEGSTRLAGQLGEGFGEVRADNRDLLRHAFTHHGGMEIDSRGDEFFVVFERAGDAVAAAVAAQRALQSQTFRDGVTVRVRIGLHTAEPYLHDDAYVGIGVHRASRICAAGHGGQILLSNATAGVVEDLDLDGVRLQDLGEHRLKDLKRPQRLYQLSADGLPSQFPPLRTRDNDTRSSVVTVLVCDLVGWRSVMRALGDENAAEAATAYQGLVIDLVRAHGGREHDVIADNVLAVFDRPRDALDAAQRVREALRIEPWIASEHRCAVRIAVHSGRCADPQRKHLGSVAFRGTRLCQEADPWQILVSHAAEALVEGDSPVVQLRDLGERPLPDFPQPAHVFEVPG